jgi:hypothetical protein
MNTKHFMTPVLFVLLLVYGIAGLILLGLDVLVNLIGVFLGKSCSVLRTHILHTPKKDIYEYVKA